MGKLSKLSIALLFSITMVACNNNISITDINSQNNDLSITTPEEKNMGTVTLNIKDLNTKLSGFNTKGIDFNNSLISQLKLEVMGAGFSTVSASQSWTSGNPVNFNLNVPAGVNRILALSALDASGNRLSTLMGAVNVIAGQNNAGTVSYFDTVIGQVLQSVLNQNAALLNSINLNNLRNYVMALTGYNIDRNTFTAINPIFLNALLIAEHILQNNGSLPPENPPEIQASGSVNVNLNVTGAKISINDMRSSPVNSTTNNSTTINNVSTGDWYVTVTKAGYVSQSVKINVNNSGTTNVNLNLVEVIVPTPTPTSTITPIPTATPTPEPTPTPTPIPDLPCTGTFCAANPLGKIAFISARDGNNELYVMNTDGSNMTRLTNNNFIENNPMWSPNGQKIVFNSIRNGYRGIYTINADGSNEKPIINNTNVDASDASWSPDGTKMVFTLRENALNNLYVMNADGTNQVNITNSTDYQIISSPTWSPDGTKILFIVGGGGSNNIFVVNSDGTNPVNLTNHGSSIDDFYPSWSPDGTKIAYSSKRNGQSNIYVMNSDGSNQTNVTDSYNTNSVPTWSPDGTKIMFNSNRRNAVYSELYTMSPDGSNQTRVSTSDFTKDAEANWSKQ